LALGVAPTHNATIFLCCRIRIGNGELSQFVQVDLADVALDMEKTLPDHIAIEVPVWLVTHREIRTSRGVKLAFDVFAGRLSANIARTA
jgi:hypothetical protein